VINITKNRSGVCVCMCGWKSDSEQRPDGQTLVIIIIIILLKCLINVRSQSAHVDSRRYIIYDLQQLPAGFSFQNFWLWSRVIACSQRVRACSRIRFPICILLLYSTTTSCCEIILLLLLLLLSLSFARRLKSYDFKPYRMSFVYNTLYIIVFRV